MVIWTTNLKLLAPTKISNHSFAWRRRSVPMFRDQRVGHGHHERRLRQKVRAEQLQGWAAKDRLHRGRHALRHRVWLAGRLAQPIRVLDAAGTELAQDNQLVQTDSRSWRQPLVFQRHQKGCFRGLPLRLLRRLLLQERVQTWQPGPHAGHPVRIVERAPEQARAGSAILVQEKRRRF